MIIDQLIENNHYLPDGVFSDGFPDDKVKDIITANNVVGGRDMLEISKKKVKIIHK